MATYTFEPAADVSDSGWAAVGASTSMWGTLSGAYSSSNYVSSPANTGTGIVSFPQNLTGLGVGATIQSVSVGVVAGLGAGTPIAGQPAALTVGVMSGINPSAYTQATIYPTAAAGSSTTFTVATYTVDPLGAAWDIQGLNNLWLQFWSKNGITDLVRVYSAYVVINYKAVPVVTVNQPTGTLNTAAPIISWTYSQPEGDFQVGATYKIFPAATQSAVGFNPQTSTPVYTGTVTGVTTAVQMTHALPSNSYFVYVQATSFAGAVSNWGYQQFSLVAPTPGIPGVADPTGVAPVGQGIVAVVADVNNGCTDITVQNTSNLLGVHMADVNIDDSGEEWSGVNVVPVESSTYFFPGDNTGQSWKFQAIAAGNMAADTGFVTVEPGQPYTACIQALAGTTVRNIELGINWYDDDYNYLGSSGSSAYPDVVGSWTEISFVDLDTDGLTNATKAQMLITVSGAAINEAHYFTHVGIMAGNQTQYTSGGTASTNLLSSWYANAQGSAPSGQSWVGSNGTTIGTYSSTPLGTSGSTGTNQNMMTCAAGAGSIALRAVGTSYSASTSAGTFTLNTPSGTASGDLMVAFLTWTASTAATGVTVPTGWTLVDQCDSNVSGANVNMVILMRTAGASEPSTYSALLNNSGVSTDRSAVVVGYSGAANVSSQFIAEAQQSGSVSGTAFTSASVSNTDPGAWRISAFATGTTSVPATFTANTQPPGIPPIQYVSTAPTYASHDALLSYVINRPPGVQSGDLMIAALSIDQVGGTITAPTGWTVARSYAGTNSGGIVTGAVAILKRTATSSEPSTWTGSLSSGTSGFSKLTTCVAYRNVAAASFQFVADGISNGHATRAEWSPNVTNTNANAWWVGVGFSNATSPSGSVKESGYTLAMQGISASMVTRMSEAYQVNTGSTGSVSLLFADSNAPVPPTVYSIHPGSTNSQWTIAAWTAFLEPLSSAPTPPANETSRVSLDVSTTDSLTVFDSNGVVAPQSWSVSATSSTTMTSEVSWIGLIRPASATVSGYVSATLQSPIALTSVNSNLLTIAGEQLTVGASFIGSVAGTVMVTANFYRANVLLQSDTQVAGQFNSTSAAWSDCFAVFDIPIGTTDISMTLASPGHGIGDVVYWNRSMMALGNQGAFQPGTSAAAHPIWSYPEIQYSEDPGDGTGFGPWISVPGTKTNVPAFGSTGLLTFQDHSVVPLRNRMYQVRTVSYGLNGDKFTSPWSAQSDVVNFQGTNWWLKDLENPANNLQLPVSWEDLTITKQTTAVQFQGLGAMLPVFLTEGYKGDTLTLKLVPMDISDHGALVNLLTANKTLYLQTDIDEAWWVQPGSDIASTVLATFNRQSDPLRKVQITFFEVAPAE